MAALLAALALTSRPAAPADPNEGNDPLRDWVWEPVLIRSDSVAIRVDRRDGSFALREVRGGVVFYSSLARRGFVSLRMRDGKLRPLDRVESVDIREEKVRLRASSSAGDAPVALIEVAQDHRSGGLALRCEVDEGDADRVRAVRILDRALWVGSDETGGCLLPRGAGEWISASAAEPLEVRLRGPAGVRSAEAEEAGAPPAAPFTLPLLGLEKGQGKLLVGWDDPSMRVEVARRASDDDRIAGASVLSVSLEAPGPRASVLIAASTTPILGVFDITRIWRERVVRRPPGASTRSKAASRPGLALWPGALVLRFPLLAPPTFPARRGEILHRIEEVSSLSDHLRGKLGVERAVLVVEDWLEPGRGEAAPPGDPLSACDAGGGDEALAEAARRVRKNGHVLGVAVDLRQIAGDLDGKKTGALEAWKRAAASTAGPAKISPLAARIAPALLVVRERSVDRAEGYPDWAAARAEFGRSVVESLGLWGSDRAAGEPIETLAWIEGVIERDRLPPRYPPFRPLFSAIHGQEARIVLPRGQEIGPDDAAGLLAHLLFGEAPAIALPPPEGSVSPPAVPPAGQGDPWCLARAEVASGEEGWSPWDIFVKTAAEVCTEVAILHQREPLVRHLLLTPDGRVRESQFGLDLRVVVNFGPGTYDDPDSGCLLPPLGFVVRHPFFYAFRALRAGGVEYDRPTLFTVRSLEGKMYLRAERTRIWHGGGSRRLRIGGRDLEVEREKVLRIW